MAKWDGWSEPYTADDETLLRAINVVDGRLHSQAMGRDVEMALRELIMDKPAFQVIKENDHLRGLLRAFLEANIRVDRKAGELSRAKPKGILGLIQGKRPTQKEKNLQGELAALKVLRDEAFKPYEMLRKLTDNENVLLKRYCG